MDTVLLHTLSENNDAQKSCSSYVICRVATLNLPHIHESPHDASKSHDQSVVFGGMYISNSATSTHESTCIVHRVDSYVYVAELTF